jgi:2-desacetyl-2-hydroxyethyl bacteriochlorophyllide A dehydrogenase
MRTLVYTAPGRVEMEERLRPEIRSGEEEIRIEFAGVCGSDISGFLGHSALRRPGLVLGHELVGWRGDGNRVVANPLVSCGRCDACISGAQNLCESWKLLGLGTTPGTFAEYVSLPSAQVYPVPETLTAEQAILAEPLANIAHMYRIVAPPAFFRLAIVGAGTMGALALQAGLRIGAQEVLVTDVNDLRLETLRGMGASAAVNVSDPNVLAEAIRKAGRGYDVVIDASGSGPARQTAFDLCRPGGQVVLLGMGAQRSEVNFVTSIRKEHRVVMSFAYTPVDFKRSLDLLIAREIDLTRWTVSLPLEQGQEALERMSSNPGVALKMMLGVSS